MRVCFDNNRANVDKKYAQPPLQIYGIYGCAIFFYIKAYFPLALLSSWNLSSIPLSIWPCVILRKGTSQRVRKNMRKWTHTDEKRVSLKIHFGNYRTKRKLFKLRKMLQFLCRKGQCLFKVEEEGVGLSKD